MARSPDLRARRWPAALRRLRPLALGFALAGLAACEHAQPFNAVSGEPNVPFSTAFPRQLTFSPSADLEPSWLPDGSGIIYTFARGTADNDRCLAILPAEGGHQLRTMCHTPVVDDADSTNTLWDPAVGPGGALAYVRESSLPGDLAPKSRELVVASLGAPDPGLVVVGFPYLGTDGQFRDDASHLHWIGADTLVYLAEQVNYITSGVYADTVTIPLEIGLVDLTGAAPARTVVPGTANATSLAVDSSGALIYTLQGDTRVYRLPRPGGAAAVLYDFGSAGVPSEVQVSGTVLVAMIGGTLTTATLGDTAVTVIPSPDPAQSVRRPALSPSGARVVIELGGSRPADLWLLQVP